MGRKARLDKNAVVQAAVDLVNAEGSEALSLSRLAEQLGIQTPSLYNHVNGLPGLQRELVLINARTLGDWVSKAAIGKAGPTAILSIAQAYRAYIKAFPGLYLMSLRAARTHTAPDPELTQAEDRVVEVTVAVIASLGLQGDDAIHAVRALRSVVHGFATLELAGGFGLPLDCDESFNRLIDVLTRGLTSSSAN